MRSIDNLIAIASEEIGYLEKGSNAFLYEKTKNAGYGNYTKYWAEIKPSYQGQPWCACFVTWCFLKAFGRAIATNLLGHYPYVYVPDLASLFTKHSNPQRGDIVCFWSKSEKEFCHTGIVTKVDGDYFETIEGNTSGASGIVANGGGVRKKSYYNSKLLGTKFIRPDYGKYIKEDDEMTADERKEFDELKTAVKNLEKTLNTLITDIANIPKGEKVYHYFSELPTDWEAKDVITELYDKGFYKGNSAGDLNLPESLLRTLVVLKRAGVFK